MLSEIKRITKSEEILRDFSLEEYLDRRDELSILGIGLDDQCNVLEYEFRGKKLEVRGIPGDYKIVLDGKLVIEFIHGDVHNDNRKLVEELLY